MHTGVSVNDIVNVYKHRYRVVGVHYGDLTHETLVAIRCISHRDGSDGEREHDIMYVPLAFFVGSRVTVYRQVDINPPSRAGEVDQTETVEVGWRTTLHPLEVDNGLKLPGEVE